MNDFENGIPDWAWGTDCAITVCDKDCRIIYMNERSRLTFSPDGSLIGTDLMACHPERARAIIRRLLSEGGTNCYTIEKGPVHKMIFQTPWTRDGKIAGLVEISMVIPAEMPHYIRQPK